MSARDTYQALARIAMRDDSTTCLELRCALDEIDHLRAIAAMSPFRENPDAPPG